MVELNFTIPERLSCIDNETCIEACKAMINNQDVTFIIPPIAFMLVWMIFAELPEKIREKYHGVLVAVSIILMVVYFILFKTVYH